MPKLKLPLYLKLLVFILLIYFGWQVLVLTKSILIPVVIAWLIAIVLYPLQAFMEKKWNFPKGVAAFVCILVVLVFLCGFIFFIGSESSAFSTDLNQLAQKFSGTSGSPLNNLTSSNNQLNIYLAKGINSFFTFFSSLMGSMLLSVVSTLITLVLIVVFTFFFLFYRKLIYSVIVQFFKEDNKVQFESSVHQVRSLTSHFMIGILMEMFAVAVLIALLLTVFGIKHGIMLGVLAAALNIIPYVGIYSATLLAVLISYGNTGSGAAITTAIIFLSVHTIDANVLMPRIMGAQVKLNSFAALVAVLTGGLIWGIPGLFLAIPTTAIAKIVFKQIPELIPLAELMGTEKKRN